MIKQEFSEIRKVEKVETQYERTTTGYHVFCDTCQKEIEDGEAYYYIELEFEGNSKELCKDCVQKEFEKWLENPTESFYAEPEVVDAKSRIGKTSIINKDLYNLFHNEEKDF